MQGGYEMAILDIGRDHENKIIVELAEQLQDCGIKALTIHGRTRSQFYSGKADWDIIKQVKESVSIPVIGNGDVVDGKSAKEMFEKTNVDGIMIGRATLGNPWIFKEIIDYLGNERWLDKSNYEFIVDKKEILNTILLHYKMLTEEKGEYTAVREMRKHVGWYIKGMENASEVRNLINSLENEDEIIDVLKKYFA